MRSSGTSSLALRLEMLEDRMLLSADIDWLHGAVTVVGTDLTDAFLQLVDPSHPAAGTKLVLHGVDAHAGTIVVDTSHLDSSVRQVQVSSFDQVTIEGSGGLRGATAIEVSHLIISAPLSGFLDTDKVSSIEFQTTHLPVTVDLLVGDHVQIKAPQFNGVSIVSLDTQLLDLVSTQATDAVTVIGMNTDLVVRTTFIPDEHSRMSVDEGHVRYYPNGIPNASLPDGIQNIPIPLNNAVVGEVPFDQVYKVLADLLARAGSNSADTILSAFTKAAASPLPAARAIEHHTPMADHPLLTVNDLPSGNVHLPAVFSVNTLPLEYHTLDVSTDLGGAHTLAVDHHAASLVFASAVHDVPATIAHAAGIATATSSLATMSGWISATLFEPIRELRNFVMQRISQEFTPGERPALLEEPRASKPVVKEDRESIQ